MMGSTAMAMARPMVVMCVQALMTRSIATAMVLPMAATRVPAVGTPPMTEPVAMSAEMGGIAEAAYV